MPGTRAPVFTNAFSVPEQTNLRALGSVYGGLAINRINCYRYVRSTRSTRGTADEFLHIGEAGKWLALIGSVVAAGQAGTTWLRGYWQVEAEKQKSPQELALADLKNRSGLGQQYLQVILDKNTKPADRAVLYTALGKLDGHPLQGWAQEQYAEYQKNLSHLLEAYKAQSDAAQLRESSEQKVAQLAADIDALNSRIALVQDDPDKRQILQDQLVSKSAELGRFKGTLSVAVVKVEETTTVISRSEQGLPIPATTNIADEITSISNKLTVSVISSVFPESALKNIQISAPYLQAAFQEFKVSDKRLAAAIIATIAVETPSFQVYEESVEQGQKWENRLGNTQPGDGVRYRGRGYLGITGRHNYEQMSVRLGLGSRLLDSPDDAKSPEVACRTLVAWFVDRQEKLSPALANGDLAAARRAVGGAGAIRQLDRFTAVYNKILGQL